MNICPQCNQEAKTGKKVEHYGEMILVHDKCFNLYISKHYDSICKEVRNANINTSKRRHGNNNS